MQAQSLIQEDPLKDKATHFRILPWKISSTVEPGGLQSMRSQTDGHGLAINFTNNPLSMSEALIHSFIQHIFTNVPVTELCSGDKIVDKETSLYPHPSWVSCSWKGRQIWVWQDFQSHRRHSLQRFLDVQPTLSPNTQPVNGCGYRSCYVFQFGVKIHH